MIRVVNWEKFQHFRDRDPIWIKLYRDLRHKREWRVLSGDSAKLLIDIWMISSENQPPGCIPDDADLAWEVRSDDTHLGVLLQELEEQGFIEMISSRYQADMPRALAREETEKRRDREETIGASVDAPTDDWPVKPRKLNGSYTYPESFERIWSAYPRRQGSNPKVGAYRAVRARVKSGDSPDDLATAAAHYAAHVRSTEKEGTEFVQQAATFFGPSEPFRDFIEAPSVNGRRPRALPGGGYDMTGFLR